MLDGGNRNRRRIDVNSRALLLEVSHEPVKGERNAISDVIVSASEQRDAHSSNIHIIRLVTYRRPRIRNLAPPWRHISS